MEKPELVVIGGPNGSGKTTLARQYLIESPYTYLSADDIASELSPNQPEKAAIQAARVFSIKFAEGLDRREMLVVESTLAGLSLKRWMTLAKEKGYRITVVFVFLDSVELNLARIAERVARGGHDVPEEDVRDLCTTFGMFTERLLMTGHYSKI
jgi:predicted ABC-type ATPase